MEISISLFDPNPLGMIARFGVHVQQTTDYRTGKPRQIFGDSIDVFGVRVSAFSVHPAAARLPIDPAPQSRPP
jgi:hypothetical protein